MVDQLDMRGEIVAALNKNFWGKVVLWLAYQVAEPKFITAFTLWLVVNLARLIEPTLIFAGGYLQISQGVAALYTPGLHASSMSILIGAPDIILPGGIVTISAKFRSKNYVSASVLSLFLLVLAVLTSISTANIFKVMTLSSDQEQVLLYWRSMFGMAYSIAILVSLLTAKLTKVATPPVITSPVTTSQVITSTTPPVITPPVTTPLVTTPLVTTPATNKVTTMTTMIKPVVISQKHKMTTPYHLLVGQSLEYVLSEEVNTEELATPPPFLQLPTPPTTPRPKPESVPETPRQQAQAKHKKTAPAVPTAASQATSQDIEETKKRIKAALEDSGKTASGRSIAAQAGCSPTTVAKYREEIQAEIDRDVAIAVVTTKDVTTTEDVITV
jgi:hypothetical protein